MEEQINTMDFNIFNFSSSQFEKIKEIGMGMKNAAAFYAKDYPNGVFYLAVPKKYGDIANIMSDTNASFWKSSILFLIQSNKELIEKKGYMNRPLSEEELEFITFYSKSLSKNSFEKNIDFKEFCRLYGYNIPFSEHSAYYINNLRKSKEFQKIDDHLMYFHDFQKSLPEGISPKHFKMKLRDTIVTSLKSDGIPLKMGAIDLNNHKFKQQTPVFENHAYYISIDLKEANWNMYKHFGGLDYKGTWGEWLKEKFNAPEALINSKSFRQIVFGDMNPGRVSKLQEVITLKLIEKLNELKDFHEGIVGISSDEVIVKVPGLVWKNPIFSIALDVPIKFKLFSVQFIKHLNRDVRINHYTDLETREVTPVLKEIPGNQFWMYFKTLILNRDLEYEDLVFENDGRMAQWCI